MRRKTRIALIVVAVVVVAALAVAAGRFFQRDTSEPAVTPEPTTPTPTQTSQTPTVDPLAGCPSAPEQITDPISMTLLDHDLEMPMLSLGLDEAGAAPAAPPGNEGYTIAWYDQGPLLGSTQGKAVLSSHTFQYGGALGNDLNDGLLSDGDVVLVGGSDGSSACYRYSGSTHVMVADYDPASDILYDEQGAPQIALVVCSDYAPDGEALGRMIYYGDLVTGDPAGDDTASGEAATSGQTSADTQVQPVQR